MSVVRKRANNAHSFSGACGGGGYGAGKLSPQLRRGQLETLSRRNEVNSGRMAEVIAAAGGQLRSGVEVILGDTMRRRQGRTSDEQQAQLEVLLVGWQMTRRV